MVDRLEQLAKTEGELRNLLRGAPTAHDPDEHFEGCDSTGAVRVTVDGHGRVHDIDFHRSWSDLIAPTELGGAVLSAVSRGIEALHQARLAAPATSSHAEATPTASDKVAQLLAPLRLPEGTAGGQVILNELLAVLEQLEASLAGFTDRVEARLTQEHTGHSLAGRVSAVVNGSGELVGVEYDQRWLRGSATAADLARETRQALAEAYQESAGSNVEDLVTEGPLAEIQRLAADPVALAHRLGLRRDGAEQ